MATQPSPLRRRPPATALPAPDLLRFAAQCLQTALPAPRQAAPGLARLNLCEKATSSLRGAA